MKSKIFLIVVCYITVIVMGYQVYKVVDSKINNINKNIETLVKERYIK